MNMHVDEYVIVLVYIVHQLQSVMSENQLET